MSSLTMDLGLCGIFFFCQEKIMVGAELLVRHQEGHKKSAWNPAEAIQPAHERSMKTW